MGDKKENLEKRLAKLVVDGWDMKTLINFAVDRLIETYDVDKETFNNDYNMYKDDLKGG